MRILTVRQPWAWALIHGGKDVENRSRNIAGDYRGPVAIHVSKTPACRIGEHLTSGGVDFERDKSGYLARSERFAWPYRLPWWDGHVIGVVDLADVHHDSVCDVGCSPRSWCLPDHWHLCLTNPHPLPAPIPAKGRLGLWHPGSELETAIREQVAA